MAEPQGFRQNGPARVAGPLAVEDVEGRSKRLGITIDRVLEEYGRIAFTSLHDLVTWDEKGMKIKDDADTSAIIEIVAAAGSGRPYRIKLHDKKPFLDAIIRYLEKLKKDENGSADHDGETARQLLIRELDRLAAEAAEGSGTPEAPR